MSPERWNTLREVFDRVSELSSPDREIALRDSCPDEEIASEVRRLIAQLEEAGSFLESPALPPHSLRDAFETEAARLQPGAQISGRFEIIRLLGCGGMGEVYEAFDHSSGESVALKTLRLSLVASQKALNRFRLELLRARRVTHPNVCRLHEIHFVEDEHGLPLVFLTMELLAGRTLQTIIRQGNSLSREEAFAWAAGIAKGLDAAHNAGVVHRDLKPGNIMVVGQGVEGRVVITDFGLAISTLESASAGISAERTVLGTPAYMAPEQLRGELATPASDIYSLGVVIAEMLFRKRPEELPASAGDRRQQQWIQAIRVCTAVDPRQRFDSAAFLIAELTRQPKNNIPRRTVLALGAAAGVAGVAYWTHSARKGMISLAVLPVDSGPNDTAYLGAATTELLIQSLRRSRRFEVPGPDTVDRFRDKAPPVRSIARTLKVDWLLACNLETSGGRVHIQARLIRASGSPGPLQKQFDAPLSQLGQLTGIIGTEVANALGPALAQAVSIEAVGSSSPEAYDLYLRGRYFWSRRQRDDLLEARRLLERCIALDPSFAPGYCGLADTLCTLADFGQASPGEVLPVAKQMAITALGLRSTLADCHVSYGTATCLNDFDWYSSERSYLRALELNPDHGQAHRSYSQVLMKMNRAEESLNHALEAIRLDSLSIPCNRNLATMLYFLRKYPDAIEQGNRIHEIAPEFFGTRELMAESYARLGRRAEALGSIAEMSADSRTPGFSLAYVATTYAILGMKKEALEAVRGLTMPGRHLPYQPVHVARVHAEFGDEKECLRWLEIANAARDTGLQILPVHQSFDPIRNTDSFRQFVAGLRIIYPPKR